VIELQILQACTNEMTLPRELCRVSYSLRPKIFDVLDFDMKIILRSEKYVVYSRHEGERNRDKDLLEKEKCVLGE
jgi:hypothetical protein